jgi:hypothetical protein
MKAVRYTLEGKDFDPENKEQVEEAISSSKLSWWQSLSGTTAFAYYMTLGYFTNYEKHKATKQMWKTTK